MSYYSSNDDISFVPLTNEQEEALVARFYAGDLAARDELISTHLKLVAKIALFINKGALPDADAISAGNYAFVVCLNKQTFDPSKSRLSNYIRTFIRGAVLEAIRKRPRGVTDEELFKKVHGNVELAVEPNLEERDFDRFRKQLVGMAMKEIPALEAKVIQLVAVQNMKFVEVGIVVNRTHSGAQKIYWRGIRRLQSYIRQHPSNPELS